MIVAGVGQRAMARLIDCALGAVMFVGLVQVVGVAAHPVDDGTGVMLVSLVATFASYLLYEVGLVARWGRTIGKQVVGIEIIRLDDYERPGLGSSLRRVLLPALFLVGFFPLYPLPYVLAALSGDHRGPHDRLAGTMVTVRRVGLQ